MPLGGSPPRALRIPSRQQAACWGSLATETVTAGDDGTQVTSQLFIQGPVLTPLGLFELESSNHESSLAELLD